MLKRFLYLDTAALSDYLSGMEDGIRDSKATRRVAGNPESDPRTHESEVSELYTDTPNAQFERLCRLITTEPEISGWIESEDSGDLSGVTVRSIIDISCEIYIPEVVKMLSPNGGMLQALDQLEGILPFISAFDPSQTQSLPGREQRDLMKGMIGAMDSKIIVVGDLEDSDWRVAGQLHSEFIKGDLEGPVNIMGKVSNRWQQGQWKPLLALPGSSLIPREQRRKMERSKPKDGEESNYLEGPALMLDILAIYR